MRPEDGSNTVLKVTQSWAKMFEYSIPEADRIKVPKDPTPLLLLTIGILGDAAANVNRTEIPSSIEDDRNLQFSARFFNAYVEGRFKEETDAYLLLLASAAFYLSDVPGSSLVLARKVPEEKLVLEGEGLEILLHWLLLGAKDDFHGKIGGSFSKEIFGCFDSLVNYYAGKVSPEECKRRAAELRLAVYERATPRQLLFADVCSAMIHLRIFNSARGLLPNYSEIPLSGWEEVLQKKTFLKELWPSQKLLGEMGVFRGVSAVVQMPTSAGKTRSTELIVRSAFMAGRTSLAVVVAPFRALCHEISAAFQDSFRGEGISVDELSDALQPDFDFLFAEDQLELVEGKRILVVTPEKLLYVLRQSPELADSIGLVIYDEGHQFDSGLRGVTYELLISSLRRRIPKEAQTVLISAVISNAKEIGEWLLGENPTIVSGQNVAPMQRRVAFASWRTERGQLQFMSEDALYQNDFYVPRLLSQQTLRRPDGSANGPRFPNKTDGKQIASFLGLKLVAQGSVALFCGRKDAVTGICKEIVEAYERSLSIPSPLEVSDREEIARLANLYRLNLGSMAPATCAAELGVLSHQGSTPHGIRIAVEHAMKEEAARFVVCTSTLAQGVNLPIRYLIVTSVYQGGERIRVRDFHNLIGRAGRAGMHVEGTILFADPRIFDGKAAAGSAWRWGQAQSLLDPHKSEPVISSLQGLFEPITNEDGREEFDIGLLELVGHYVDDEQGFEEAFSAAGPRVGWQIRDRFSKFAAIESYLMAQWDDAEDFAKGLAEETLAYALITDDQKKELVALFDALAARVQSTIPDGERRAIFARTLQGVTMALKLEQWVFGNIEIIKGLDTKDALVRFLWPMISDGIENRTFQRIDRPDLLPQVAGSWISGVSYGELLEFLKENGVKLHWGQNGQKRDITVENVVEICEGALGYGGAIRIGAILDLVSSRSPDDEETGVLVERLKELHKQFKYGLPATSAIALYECGFSDRVVASHLSYIVGDGSVTRSKARSILSENQQAAWSILQAYPLYFQSRFAGLVS